MILCIDDILVTNAKPRTVDANDIPDMPIELDLLDKLKARVQLAKKIDSAQHKVKKEKHEKNWLREAAEAMEIELDSDLDDKLRIQCSPLLIVLNLHLTSTPLSFFISVSLRPFILKTPDPQHRKPNSHSIYF